MDAILIRHGQKHAAAPGQDSLIDPELTCDGARQAIEAGIMLSQREYEDLGAEPMLDHVGDVCASPYKRTIQTAIFALSQIQDRAGDVTVSLILEPLLAESFIEGERCEGSSKQELIRWIYDDGPKGLRQSIINGYDANQNMFIHIKTIKNRLIAPLGSLHI